MCGRYTLGRSTEELIKRFGIAASPDRIRPRFNIAPGQEVPVVLLKSEERVVEMLKWGLVPFWAREAARIKPLINARAETLAEKNSFKHAFKNRRCLIPADGFYEWQKNGQTRKPLYIYLRERPIFAFAGLWDRQDGDCNQATCAIITVESNNIMADIHHRMPAILNPDDETIWLESADKDLAKAQAVLNPYNDSQMSYYPVSTRVNSYRNDSPDLIQTVACRQ